MTVQIALAVSLALNACFAALLFKFASQSLTKLNESHERTTEYTKDLVDRLMAVDYVGFQAEKAAMGIQSLQPISETPDQPQLVVTSGPDIGGFGSRLGLRALTAVPFAGDGEQALEEELRRELP